MKKIFKSLILCLMIIPCAIFFVGCMKEDEPTTPPASEPTNEVKVLLSDDGKTLYRFAPDNDETEYVVPEGIERIDVSAFEDCDNLTKVTLPATLRSIQEKAFYHCNNLTTVEINSDISVGDESFMFCFKLSNIDISKITSLGEYSFCECNDLTSVTIAKEITHLYEGAFSQTDSLTTVNFEPNSTLSIIDTKAFQKSGLTSINLPTSCTFIGNRAFYESALSNITIGKNITTIASYAFAGCSNLLTVEFEIGRTTYVEFDDFYDIEYGNTFAECSKLVSVVNYPTRSPILEDMFYGCRKLETFTFANDSHGQKPTLGCSVEAWAFYYCDSLEEINLPAYFVNKLDKAFYRCTALSVVIINGDEISNQLIKSSADYLIDYATTVYIKTGLNTTNSTYLLENFTKQATSDKAGYDMYVRNAE